LYENTEIVIAAGQREELVVPLTVEGVEEQVDVSSSGGVSTAPQNNAGATVLKEKDLEALPDDPDELEAALQALAGPSSGPNGGQIYIDGFTGGRLPPKESIREIRIFWLIRISRIDSFVRLMELRLEDSLDRAVVVVREQELREASTICSTAFQQ
jgi:hypothetical protein